MSETLEHTMQTEQNSKDIAVLGANIAGLEKNIDLRLSNQDETLKRIEKLVTVTSQKVLEHDKFMSGMDGAITGFAKSLESASKRFESSVNELNSKVQLIDTWYIENRDKIKLLLDDREESSRWYKNLFWKVAVGILLSVVAGEKLLQYLKF